MEEEQESARGVSRFSSATTLAAGKRVSLRVGTNNTLILPRDLLDKMADALRVRSAGWRESAAVIGGIVIGSQWVASRTLFHHDLDEDRAGPVSIELSEKGKLALYGRLATFGLRVVALAHTHPDSWVGLSLADQSNQISSRRGVWSIVLPHYACDGSRAIASWGIHVRGDHGWTQLSRAEVNQRVVIR
jgi:hypothetical protein